MRLDTLLVRQGYFASRARAQGAVKAGLVWVAGAAVQKPSAQVEADAEIVVEGDVHPYVSRGGVKLAEALRTFEIDPSGMICLDLGASTGGFTDVLLQRGAAKIYAVDVGTNQLHPRLAVDPRVVNLAKTHAKDLTPALVGQPIDLLVADVSFIGLRKALPSALALCAPESRVVALVKPQFELGPEKIGKGGLVSADVGEIVKLVDAIAAWLAAQGWRIDGVIESPIAGGDGNREFLLGATRTP